MNMILTSECEGCDYGTIDNSNKACVKVKCADKNKEYYYGQYVSCDNKKRKRISKNKINT